MFKLKISDKWYWEALEAERGVADISAGPIMHFGIGQNGNFSFKPTHTMVQYGLAVLMRKLRVSKELTIEKLAKKIEVDVEHIFAIEHEPGYKPPLRTMMQLSDFFGVPYKALMQLVGAVPLSKKLEEDVVLYAAQSDSFEKLTPEEKRQLNEIVKILKNHGDK